jgi:hypothetical protein
MTMLTIKRFLELGGNIKRSKGRTIFSCDNVQLMIKNYPKGGYSVEVERFDPETTDKAIQLFMKVYEKYGQYGNSKFKDT